MAKVSLDRDNAQRDLQRRKLGVFLRLESALAQLVQDIAPTVSKFRNMMMRTSKVDREEFLIREPVEIAEVWANLDFFQPRIINDLRLLRGTFKNIGRQYGSLRPNTVWEVHIISPAEISAVETQIKTLDETAKKLLHELGSEISALVTNA